MSFFLRNTLLPPVWKFRFPVQFLCWIVCSEIFQICWILSVIVFFFSLSLFLSRRSLSLFQKIQSFEHFHISFFSSNLELNAMVVLSGSCKESSNQYSANDDSKRPSGASNLFFSFPPFFFLSLSLPDSVFLLPFSPYLLSHVWVFLDLSIDFSNLKIFHFSLFQTLFSTVFIIVAFLNLVFFPSFSAVFLFYFWSYSFFKQQKKSVLLFSQFKSLCLFRDKNFQQ